MVIDLPDVGVGGAELCNPLLFVCMDADFFGKLCYKEIAMAG